MALTKVTGDFIETGSITQGHLHSSHGITLDHIGDGSTNTFFTTANARAAISATGSLSYNNSTGVMSFTMPTLNTTNITEGDKLFFTNARVDSRVGSLSTSDLSEGTNLYFTNARAISALTAGTNIAIASNGTISSTDTNTTYSVGDGGLTQNNFTNTLKTKLDGIAASANNYSLPFTDNSSNWNTAYGWGNHASGGYASGSVFATFGTYGWQITDYDGATADSGRIYYDNGNRAFRFYSEHSGSTGAANIQLYDGSAYSELTKAKIDKLDGIAANANNYSLSAGTRHAIQYIDGYGAVSYDKLRVWDSGSYAIGMYNAQSFGWLNDYAMTFQMNNDSDRGFVWRHDAMAASDGAMSLTTEGNLSVKNAISIGGSTTYYMHNGSWGWRHQTPHGYIEFGPANTSHAHIYTDRSNFYFNVSTLYANGNTMWHAGSGSITAVNDMRAQTFYDSNNTGYYLDPASTSTISSLLLYGNLKRAGHNVGHLEGSYNNVGGNASNTNPIYTIGSSYNPASTSLSSMYGIGYAHPNLSGWGSGKTSDWGMYVASNGSIDCTIGDGSITAWFANQIKTQTNLILAGSDSYIMGGTITSRQGARFIDVGYSGSCYIEANRTDSASSTILFGAASSATGIWSRVGTTNGGATHSSSPRQFTITMGSTVEFTMATNGVMSGDFNDTSDVLFKKNIENHSYGLAAVNTLKPREFNWKRNTRPQGKQVGFIAQEVEEIIPEVVHGYDGAKSINGTGLISVLTKAIQELSQQVTDLKAEVELLKQ